MFDLTRPYVFVGDHTILTNLNAGPAMFLDLRDPVCLAIYLTGEWEGWLTGTFLSVVRPGMVVLDIGSHSGYFTLLAAQQVGPRGYVHAFEPNPFHHRNLIKSAAVNGYAHVQLHRVMVSNKNGEEMIETLGDGGSSIVYPALAPLITPTKTKVRKAILKDLIAPHTKVDVIKIDIDGGEPYIMDSLFEVIDASGPLVIFMEYLPLLWGGIDPRPIMQKFYDRGFAIFNVPMDRSAMTPVTLDQLAAHTGQLHLDLIMVRH
ncbi:FkbM family methyltransferase [Cohnella sp. SGD-V74]|uniref:FkbM family methyltransferase n=1 Tax=unclassified Cohnella TaxID=2636738 RepID=UPI000D489176|nr:MULTISPECIES: FkbM family methyltransferase [unclassified Cohnella]PRX59553.1 FkbM family methyltransferase [Cohnella sp. SGD-V74]